METSDYLQIILSERGVIAYEWSIQKDRKDTSHLLETATVYVECYY